MPFFHHRISGILRIFVPQISLISAGGFLPLFVGRYPTLNATRPLALEHEWAKDILPLQACPPLHFQFSIFNSQFSILNSQLPPTSFPTIFL